MVCLYTCIMYVMLSHFLCSTHTVFGWVSNKYRFAIYNSALWTVLQNHHCSDLVSSLAKICTTHHQFVYICALICNFQNICQEIILCCYGHSHSLCMWNLGQWENMREIVILWSIVVCDRFRSFLKFCSLPAVYMYTHVRAESVITGCGRGR